MSEPFQLPEGYTFAESAGAVLGDVAGYSEYGGATVTQLWDGAGVHHIGLCAKDAAGVFLFRVFRETAPGAYEHVPLPDACDGRGSIAVDHFSGSCRYIAWRGNQFFENAIPGAVPLAVAGGITIQDVKNALWNDPWFKGDLLYFWLTWGSDPRVATYLASLGAGANEALTRRVSMLETTAEDVSRRLSAGGRALTGGS